MCLSLSEVEAQGLFLLLFLLSLADDHYVLADCYQGQFTELF